MMKTRSAYHFVIALGTILLSLQLLLLYSLLSRETDNLYLGDNDLEAVLNTTNPLNIPVVILDPIILNKINEKAFYTETLKVCLICSAVKPIVLGVEYKKINPIKENSFLNKLAELGFSSTVLFNRSPREPVPNQEVLPIAYIIKRKISLVISVFHEREGNFWWHGDVYSDPEAETKLQALSIPVKEIAFLEHEGAFDKFEVAGYQVPGYASAITVPSDIPEYFLAVRQSRFKECSWSRAMNFEKKYGSMRNTPQGKWFAHRAWKILARTKTLLDGLGVPFWISSGTCLGYFRQCDVIPYGKDVDIGIFASDFKKQIVPAFVSRGMALKHSFGRLNDSYELSFVDLSSGVKLDIFFFYEGKEEEESSTRKNNKLRLTSDRIIWNGGTQARTGKKFKYIFPHFTLCWTEFLALKVRIPCNTLDYILANYGPDWATPISSWDWKSSPPNVSPNGEWPQSEWPEVIQVYYPELNIPKSHHQL